jgi:hypothetical protein
MCAEPKKRFNVFQNWSEIYPIPVRSDMFDYCEELMNYQKGDEEDYPNRERYSCTLISENKLLVAKQCTINNNLVTQEYPFKFKYSNMELTLEQMQYTVL